MENETPMGLNRTGTAMSPVITQEMLDGYDELAEIDTEDATAKSLIRETYIRESGALGSVPIPASLRGAWEAGKALLTGEHPQVFIDKLGERLAFERGGIRLYEALLAKCTAAPDVLPDNAVQDLQRFQQEEAAHFQLLTDAMVDLGADPTSQTPSANIAGMEAMGLAQVLGDPRTSIAQSLHAILVAELVDTAGWDDLVALTERLGHEELGEEFRLASQQEARHLATIRGLLTQMTLEQAQ